ncbi:MAG: hypothetical protein KC776_20185 [Myxococcales bacterium]|nr:hypothetical protein [Myxococcales bacterium]MCB9579680.1 hypothetical protein [Polyangiaceae bacterium]
MPAAGVPDVGAPYATVICGPVELEPGTTGPGERLSVAGGATLNVDRLYPGVLALPGDAD